MDSKETARRYELDWLRVCAIMVVFMYHSTRFFNLGDWHVKNVDTYVWVEIWNIFATRWMMPIFFIISGASLFYTTAKPGGWRKFYADKFLRLMIPVLVATVTHSVVQVYLERVSHGQFSGSLFAFVPHYFSGVYLGVGMPGNFAFHGMHLWYLLFLFVYSLICYRLFVWLNDSGQKILNSVTSLLAIPGLMYLGFPVPLVLMKVFIPQAVMDVGNGGWGFLYYIWFLISGFLIISDSRLQQRILTDRWVSLGLGLGLSAVYLFHLFGSAPMVISLEKSAWLSTLLSFFSAWCWILAILGFAMRFLAFDHPLLGHANEGVMPFYILHQTVLLVLGYYVMAGDMHAGMKWAIVFIGSFMIIVTMYLLFIRNHDPLRFLFGMKTTNSSYNLFRKPMALSIFSVMFISLIVFAVVNPLAVANPGRSAMPLVYDAEQDIVLNAGSLTERSETGVRLVNDEAASSGRAIEFFSGANQRPQSQPQIYVDIRFSASAGQYYVWLRGKTDVDSGYTDSVWMQVDDQIGTRTRSARMGNWLDVHPAGVYGWAGDTDDPVAIILKHTGDHTIRIQPRQTPHRIDQIWLSRSQYRIPNTTEPIR